MGVYIPGIEMPKDCDECWKRFHGFGMVEHDEEWGTFYCKMAKGFCSDLRTKCPLIPIPTHGRLIDADALLERFEKEENAADEHGRDFSFSFKSGGVNCTEWWPVQQMLMDAPTIIPAEEGET